MSFADSILELISVQSIDNDDPRVLAEKEPRATNERANVFAKTMPDDRKNLQEEQEMWRAGWDDVFENLVACLRKAEEVGIEPRVDNSVIFAVQESKKKMGGWDAAKVMQEEAARADGTMDGAVAATEEEVGATGEEESGSTSDEEEQEKGEMPTRASKRKRHADTPGDGGKSASGPKKTVDLPVHDMPCGNCQQVGAIYKGSPNRMCDLCERCDIGRHKRDCSGRHGRRRAMGGATIEQATTSKEKGPGAPQTEPTLSKPVIFATSRRTFPAPNPANPATGTRKMNPKPSVIELEDNDNEDDDGPVPVKRQRTATCQGPFTKKVDAAKRAVLAIEVAMLSTRARLRSLEVQVADMAAVVASQQAELETVKDLLKSL